MKKSCARVFQALRIDVNNEFEVLEMDSRRILKVKFTILPKEMDESESKE